MKFVATFSVLVVSAQLAASTSAYGQGAQSSTMGPAKVNAIEVKPIQNKSTLPKATKAKPTKKHTTKLGGLSVVSSSSPTTPAQANQMQAILRRERTIAPAQPSKSGAAAFSSGSMAGPTTTLSPDKGSGPNAGVPVNIRR
jgi:hypothetical protein